jgi:hypothetical protein
MVMFRGGGDGFVKHHGTRAVVELKQQPSIVHSASVIPPKVPGQLCRSCGGMSMEIDAQLGGEEATRAMASSMQYTTG